MGVLRVLSIPLKALYQAFALSVRKLPAMVGGIVPLMLALAISCLMFFAAHRALNTEHPNSLKLAVVNGDDSELSRELIGAIRAANVSSVELFECKTLDEANALTDDGKVEGTLIILESLEDNLRKGTSAFDYMPAKGSSSAQAARELIAGEAVTIGSRLRSIEYFEKLTGRAPSADEKRALYEAYASEREREGSAVERKTVFASGANERIADNNLLGAFYARYSGFSTFVIMLVLLMCGAFCGSKDEKHSRERISSLFLGRIIGFLSNLFALMILGIALLALSFIPSGGASAYEVLAGLSYVFCASSLAILLGGLSGSARAELASPLVAFLTALAGGCFADISSLGSAFKTLSGFTPQGQYLAALSGEKVFAGVLFAVGLAFLLLSRLLSGVAKKAIQAR